MKSLLIDLNDNSLRVVHPEELKDYYELLNCRHIEIVRRKIGNKLYQIICDEEGLLKDDCIVSALDSMGKVMFVGNILICGLADEEGELTDLSNRDIEYIMGHILFLDSINSPHGEQWLLTECNY